MRTMRRVAMRYLAFLLLFSWCLPGVSFTIPNRDFRQGKQCWLGAGEVYEGELRIDDNSVEAALYTESDYLPFIRTVQDWRFRVHCRTTAVTGRAMLAVRFYDAQKQRVYVVTSNTLSGDQSGDLVVLIEAKKVPETAVTFRLMLQSAAGSVAQTGTAVFSGLQAMPLAAENAGKTLSGLIDFTAAIDLKGEGINLPGTNGRFSPFMYTEGQARLEFSWRDRCEPGGVSWGCDGLPPTVQAAVWDDVVGAYLPMAALPVARSGNRYFIDWRGLAPTRKIMLTFGAEITELPPISDLVVYRRDVARENWQANWIWFTRDRVENVAWRFRRVFQVSEQALWATLQLAIDDGGQVWLNGQAFGAGGSWKAPKVIDVSAALRAGANVIAVEVRQDRYAAGVLAEMDWRLADGTAGKLLSDDNWRCAPVTTEPISWQNIDFDDNSWRQAVLMGRPPTGWGEVPYRMYGLRQNSRLAPPGLPEHLETGIDYELSFRLESLEGSTERSPITLCLSRGGHDFQVEALGVLEVGEHEKQVSLCLRLREYLYPGDYQLELRIPGMLIDGGSRTVRIINPRQTDLADSQIKTVQGTPGLYVDGEQLFTVMQTNWGGAIGYSLACGARAASSRLLHIYAEIPHAEADDIYDFSHFDSVVYNALRGAPEARLMVRITTRNSMTPEFRKKYPEELVVFDNGECSGHASLASPVWRAATERMMRALVQHVRSGPYANRLIGIFPSDGEEGQWMHYWGHGDPRKAGALSDYSRPMLAYFREWLRTKYASDQKLADAWLDPQVTLALATIPKSSRRIGTNGVFRNLPADRPAIDYAEALSDVVCDGIIRDCRAVKEASDGLLLTGVLYGHIMDLGASWLGEQTGYLKMRRVIESPYIDYLAGPLHYGREFRDLGSPSSFDYPTPGTLRLHNKIWLTEADLRTHLTHPPGYAYGVRTVTAAAAVCAREFSKSLCAGAGLYYCNLAGGNRGWFDDPELTIVFKQLQQVADTVTTRSGAQQSVSEVALVFSDRSLCYLRSLPPRHGQDEIMTEAIKNRREIALAGFPFDEYLADDFLNPDMPNYRLYIFMNVVMLTEPERNAIRRRLDQTGATALWFYAPGYLDGVKTDLGAIATLSGFTVERQDNRSPIELDFVQTEYGQGEIPAARRDNVPLFCPVSLGQQVLARRRSDGRPLLARLGKNYFSSCYGLPTAAFRRIAEEAGVFIYSRNDDAVYVCRDVLAIHTGQTAGERTIELPGGVHAREVFPETISAWSPRLQFNSVAPHTRIFMLQRP